MAEGGLMAESLMAVLAHPDDETFGLGGTIATYARRGHDVYYVCATGGEIGTVDEKYLRGFRDTAELRAGELMRAAKVLGIMFEGIHVHDLTCLRLNVFALSIRVCELGFAVVQEDGNRLGMAVHH